jgi:glycosyltransferase involved in cell wall biosynthesis
MKILYDHQIFDLQQYGGISRYFCELMRAFTAAGEPAFALACPYTTNAYLWQAEFVRLNTPLTRRRFRGSGVVNNLLARRRNGRAARTALAAGDYDLFHPTYYDPYFLPLLGGKPFVLTVHDMIHELYPDCFPADDPTRQWKALLVQRAAHVIADSSSTRADLVAFCGVPADRVTVIHLGCSRPGPAGTGNQPELPARYLLFVGERSRYKNFDFAVQALAPLLADQAGLQLVCVGGGTFTAQEQSLLARLGLAGRCRQLTLDDAGLARAYRNALALVFPSLCEGFGIPVLEAFANGCPAILSDRSSLPEVGGEAALYFDPENGEALRSQVSQVLRDALLRERLVQAGRERARAFSWERTARETRGVYELVVSQSLTRGGSPC